MFYFHVIEHKRCYSFPLIIFNILFKLITKYADYLMENMLDAMDAATVLMVILLKN